MEIYQIETVSGAILNNKKHVIYASAVGIYLLVASTLCVSLRLDRDSHN